MQMNKENDLLIELNQIIKDLNLEEFEGLKDSINEINEYIENNNLD